MAKPIDHLVTVEELEAIIKFGADPRSPGMFCAQAMAAELLAKREWVPRLLDTVELYRSEYPEGRDKAVASEDWRLREFHKRILDARSPVTKGVLPVEEIKLIQGTLAPLRSGESTKYPPAMLNDLEALCHTALTLLAERKQK